MSPLSIYMYACIHPYKHIHVALEYVALECIDTNIYMYICVYIYIKIYEYKYTYTYMCVYIYMYIYLNLYPLYIYIYIYVYKHTRTPRALKRARFPILGKLLTFVHG